MQLYAIDQTGAFVFADQASKQVDYCCLECQGPVRLRSGAHRRKHFFHTEGKHPCRLGGKTMEHLQTQCFIQKLLGHANCQLERRFPEIDRIADAVWESEKLIFEVQCSSITASEVEQRNRDYASLGYQVVWVLHTKTFNKHLVTAAEMLLQTQPHYYTDIDLDGQGTIFDQFQLIKRGRRFVKLEPLPILLREPVRGGKSILRPHDWLVCFKGGLIDANPDYSERALALIKEYQDPIPEQPSFFETFIARPYRLLFQLWLEKFSR